MSCSTSCERICQGTSLHCHANCQYTGEGDVPCTTNCETGCMSTCEKRCQSTCETSCQSTCEKTCQTAAQTNKAPGMPASISVPDPIRAGEATTISWGRASDTNLSGYELYRSLDNESYKLIYKGADLSYVDTIPKDDYKTVRYRVRGYDPYTTGSYRTSDIVQVINNEPPKISGSDKDLGAKTNNFGVEYIITDEKSTVTVEITLDGVIILPEQEVSTGVRRTVDIDLSVLDLGSHTLVIRAKDQEGVRSAPRTYTFSKTNTAPTISGVDEDLGAKNTGFSIVYQVNDMEEDTITITERLNGTVLRTINNAKKLEDITLTIDVDLLYTLELNKVNEIEIEAKDDKGGTTYRRKTFVRDNTPPIISGADSDLGEMLNEVNITYSATDVEGDAITLSCYLDDKLVVEPFEAEDNHEYHYTLSDYDFSTHGSGLHTFKVVAQDDAGGVSQRVWSYTATANRLVLETRKPTETDALASRLNFSANRVVAPEAVEKVEACNNGFDDEPTWEDATATYLNAEPYFFRNAEKTADKAGILIRYIITKGTDESSVYGVGGTFE